MTVTTATGRTPDCIIICRSTVTGELSFYNQMGTHYMARKSAEQIAKDWSERYPNMQYIVVSVAA